MADLTTNYMGLELSNPIVAASSGLTGTIEGVLHCAQAGVGAIVLKSIFEEQIISEVEGLYPVDHQSLAHQRLTITSRLMVETMPLTGI